MLKKDKERRILEEFIKCYNQFPKGRIQDSEGPDFLVQTPTQVVGIELIEFVRGQSNKGSLIRQAESSREELVKQARKEYEHRNKPPLRVSFFWCGEAPIKKNSIPDLVKTLASMIEDKYRLCSEIELTWGEFENTPLEGILNSIRILHSPQLQRNEWISPEAGWVGIEPQELQNIISSKQKNMRIYLEKCNTVWLLIYAGGDHISSTVVLSDIEKIANQHRFISHFQKVMFFDLWNRKSYNLKLSARSRPQPAQRG